MRATCETGDEELFENWENWQCEAWLLGQQVLYRSVLMTNLSVSVTPRAINILFAPLGSSSKSLTQRRKDAEISE